MLAFNNGLAAQKAEKASEKLEMSAASVWFARPL